MIRLLSFLVVAVVLVACQSQSKSQEKPRSEELAPKSFKQAFEEDENAIIIDVRTPGEVAGGMIPGAVNIDVKGSDFNERVSMLDKNQTYYVYCLSGARSARAAAQFRNSGIKEVYNLDGGLLSWQKAGLLLIGAADIKDKITPDQYRDLVTSDKLVLVDFYAPWCAPCVRMEPMLDEIQVEQESSLSIVRVNIEENKQLIKSMGIDEIPVFRLYDKGEEKWELKGELKKDRLMKNLGL